LQSGPRDDRAHYTTLQHTATHCDTLQHTASHCNTHYKLLGVGCLKMCHLPVEFFRYVTWPSLNPKQLSSKSYGTANWYEVATISRFPTLLVLFWKSSLHIHIYTSIMYAQLSPILCIRLKSRWCFSYVYLHTHTTDYIYIYLYIQIYVYTHTHIYICIYIYICTYTYIYIYVYVIYTFIRIYIYIYIYTYICVYIYIYIYV